MLPLGGQLVTITPNWHMRPFDATTALAYPPRTEAQGLHLKEYTLREVRGMLYESGFAKVATPLTVLPERFVRCGNGLAGLKCLLEPALEWLPFAAASLAVRGLRSHLHNRDQGLKKSYRFLCVLPLRKRRQHVPGIVANFFAESCAHRALAALFQPI